MIQYENVFKSGGNLYARTYNTETNESSLNAVRYIPPIYLKSDELSEFKSINTKENLKEFRFNTMKEYKDAVALYSGSNVPIYGNKSLEHGYIREHFGTPNDNNHDFVGLYIDIETLVADDGEKNDWKPTKHNRAAMAIISSIQMYDTKSNTFIILGYKKDWENKNNFTSPHGPIKYIKIDTEEQMLKTFLTILKKINPTFLAGWNSEFYDYPYLTNRIIRVLDKRTDLYTQSGKDFKFNIDCLSGSWVKQLSPVGRVTHREIQTNFGKEDTFSWIGYFTLDYKDLYHKYTYTALTSYSLDSVAGHELGSNKVNHDEFTDFGDFYREDFDTFIEYGVQDVALLYELDNKLKLIDLAKYIAYNCGVSLNDVAGTLKQWQSFIYNESLNKNYILPLENTFPERDIVLPKYVVNSENLVSDEKKDFFKDLLNNPELHGQRFPGGWTRGTGTFRNWVFSLDFTSLYPSAIMWANIGIDTLIEPKDLPKELLDLRAKYFIYYPKDADPKELEKFDFAFIDNVLRNENVMREINEVLTRHNVSATPNGMFFTKAHRSIMSSIIENLIVDRKSYKKAMKSKEQEIENLKLEKEKYNNKSVQIKEIDDEIFRLSALRDRDDSNQMGIKILINSLYGSLSMKTNNFAGQAEYFSAAVTSTSRIANILISQEQSIKVSTLSGATNNEMRYGNKTYLDSIVQGDTDSAYISIAGVIEKKFGKDYEETQTKERLVEFTLNYINKVALPLVRDKLDNVYAYAMNAYLPDKLQEDPEVVCDNFISIKPKMYFGRKLWDEGVHLAKPKLKVTGLSMVRSTTPKFYRQELKEAMEILIDGNIPKVINYIAKVEEETREQDPKDIAINQGVTSLDYNWDETEKKYKKWTGEKWLGAPVNSRASLVHNKYIQKNNHMNIKEIEAGDKISFIYMKVPNTCSNSNAFAFKESKIFDQDLEEYIDYDTMFEKGFMKPIKLITDPLKWDLTPKEDQIDESEW